VIVFEYEPAFCVENEAKLPEPLFNESMEDYRAFIDKIGYKITQSLWNNNYVIEPQ
jgi:hypothetical protein